MSEERLSKKNIFSYKPKEIRDVGRSAIPWQAIF